VVAATVIRRYAIALSGIVVLALLAASQVSPPAASTPPRDILPLQLEEQIPVPNVAGRLDHFTADPKRRRLIFSALGNNTVEVIDTFEGKLIHTITGLSEPQGVVYVADFDKLVVASAGNGKVSIYDGSTYALRKTLDFGEDPDNVRYDATSRKIFVGYGRDDGGIGVIDPATYERLNTNFKTGGHPESFQIEASGSHIFVNVPDAGNVVEAIDRKTGTATKWPLKDLRQNYAMALNEEDHRLFTVTRKTPTLVVLDTQTGREVARLRAAGECDDVYFDASRKRIYVIGGEGFISVFQQNDPEHYELVANVPSTIGAKTGYFFAKRDRLYVGVPAKGNEPAAVWTYEAED
jgi:DNA-binding beta-propeller fold protein YncE